MDRRDVNTVELQKRIDALQRSVAELRQVAGTNWVRGFGNPGRDLWAPFGGGGTNGNEWSNQARLGQDATQAMRDVNALEVLVSERLFVRQVGGHELKQPQGMALTAAGDIWVVDRGHNSLQKFSPGGDFIEEFGAFGNGPGQFNRPTGVAIDSGGNLYVVDSLNFRVQKFDSAGTFLLEWGSLGTDDSQFRGIIGGQGPEHIAINPIDGNVYVPENGLVALQDADRIQIFTPTGTFVSAISGLPAPSAIVFDPDGNFFVEMATPFSVPTGFSDGRVWKFDVSGDLRLTFMVEGTGDGQSFQNTALALDSDGNIYASDWEENRIQKFDPTGAFVLNWGTLGTQSGEFERIRGLLVDGGDGLYVSDGETVSGLTATEQRFQHNGRVQKFDAEGAQGNAPEFWFPRNFSFIPANLFVDSSDNIFVDGSVGIDSRSGKFDINGRLISAFAPGSVKTGIIADSEDNIYKTAGTAIKIYDPDGVFVKDIGSGTALVDLAIDSEGALYTVDNNDDKVLKFSGAGALLLSFGETGSGNGQFQSPAAVALDSAENIYVVDNGNQRIQKFDSAGNFLLTFGTPGDGDGELSGPFGIGINATNDVYIADSGNHRIQKFDTDGVFQSKFGSEGFGNAEFQTPVDVHFDSAGNIYVVDALNNRIQVFTAAHAYVSEFGPQGVAIPPLGIIADDSDNVYISERRRVSKFDSADNLLLEFGGVSSVFASGNFNLPEGSDDGKFDGAGGMAFDPAGNVYVVDRVNERVQKFDSAGNYLSRFGGGPVFGGFGLDTDSEGNLYLGDEGLIKKYDADGNFVMRFGVGQPSGAKEIHFDSLGNIYSLALAGSDITKFDSAGNFLLTWDADFAPFLSGITSMSISSADDIYVVQASGRIAKYDTNGNLLDVFFTDDFFFPAVFSAGPMGIRGNSIYIYREQGGLNPDVGRVTRFNLSGKFLEAFITFGDTDDTLRFVSAMTVHATGLYFLDGDADRIKVFGLDGTPKFAFGERGSGDGEFKDPLGLVLDASGNIFVSDNGNGRVQKFDGDGVFISEFGKTSQEKLISPFDVAVASDGSVFVSQSTNESAGDNFIKKFDSNHNFLFAFNDGATGDDNTQFRGIVFDSTDKLYASDIGNGRILVFDIDGVLLSEFGETGSDDGQLRQPQGLDADADDRIYVCDNGNGRVQILENDGTFREKFGKEDGTAENPNHGAVRGITDLAVTSTNDIYTASVTYGRIDIYGKRPDPSNQTAWAKWTRQGAVSLGLPDGGIAVPALDALDNGKALVAPETLDQMRRPIEVLAPGFINGATSNPFNWIDLDPDNLYFVSLGDRDTSPTDFGFATPSPAYDWERMLAQMRKTKTVDLDIGEIKRTIAELQASVLV
jgi:sugar lactone lactonase YvrE